MAAEVAEASPSPGVLALSSGATLAVTTRRSAGAWIACALAAVLVASLAPVLPHAVPLATEAMESSMTHSAGPGTLSAVPPIQLPLTRESLLLALQVEALPGEAAPWRLPPRRVS